MDLDRVDPELREGVERLPVPDASKKLTRVAVRLATRFMPVPRTEVVDVTTVKVNGLRFRIYRPEVRLNDGGLLWLHGGGLLFGDARQDEALCAEAARSSGSRWSPRTIAPHPNIRSRQASMMCMRHGVGFTTTRRLSRSTPHES